MLFHLIAVMEFFGAWDFQDIKIGGFDMKKNLLWILVMLVCLSFVACNSNTAATDLQEPEESLPEVTITTPAPEESKESLQEVTQTTPAPEESTDTTAAMTDSASENAWAEAYLGVVNRLIDQYGEGAMATSTSGLGKDLTGVGIVRLIDFDGDGVYELYCAYQVDDCSWSYKQIIYGYDNGLIVLLEECRVSNPGTDVSPTTIFLTKDGKVYLVDEYEITDGNYYTLQDGEMVSVFSYYYNWLDGGPAVINGDTVTEEEGAAAIEEMRAGGTIEYIILAHQADSAQLTKTQAAIEELIAQTK